MAFSSSKALVLVCFFFLFASLAFGRGFSNVGSSSHDLKSTDKHMELFESWMSEHGKIYETNEEKLLRFKIFKDRLEYIDERNKVLSNYWLGLNEFVDLSHQEFKNKYLVLKFDNSRRRESQEEFSYRDVELPTSVDWRKKGGGEKGYIRMRRNIGKPYRIYGLYKMASYPTKKKKLKIPSL